MCLSIVFCVLAVSENFVECLPAKCFSVATLLFFHCILVVSLLCCGRILFPLRCLSACLPLGCFSISVIHSAAETGRCHKPAECLVSPAAFVSVIVRHFKTNSLWLSLCHSDVPFWMPCGRSTVVMLLCSVRLRSGCLGVVLRMRNAFPTVCCHVPPRLRGECSSVTIQLLSDCFRRALQRPLVCFLGCHPTGQQPQQQRQPQQFAVGSPSGCSPNAHRLLSDSGSEF